MQDFRKLTVWDRAHSLTLSVYAATRSFPRDEVYGITGQMRRCSASIPTNIAEGCGRGGTKDFARFLQIAMGSASELEYHLLLAKDLGYLNESVYNTLAGIAAEIRRMLFALVRSIKSKPEN